eukprot:TRINITY_DN1608_c0_g1_i13.p3 TRINITY_DN1608_c0_g1~~TRINITY_DN1608_c0_g1_i13.p3  ORF type:complete len:222 (-),score=64.53 TRINITY_DN1608_c0_g1_i13:1103-1768(-)
MINKYQKIKKSKLEKEKTELNDLYQKSLLRQSDLSARVWKLERKYQFQENKFHELEKANPKFAIEKLKEGKSLFVFNCRTFLEKEELLNQSIILNNSEVTNFVLSYLQATLLPDLFDTIVKKKEAPFLEYLEHLKKNKSPLFKTTCIRNGRYAELAAWMYKNALAECDVERKAERLQKTLDFCNRKQWYQRRVRGGGRRYIWDGNLAECSLQTWSFVQLGF